VVTVDLQLADRLSELVYREVDADDPIALAFQGEVTGVELVTAPGQHATYYAVVRLRLRGKAF
jgi:uncharacterized protein involved in type VI secretion and phage assembly